MADLDERELLAALRGYLEDLRESGLDEIPFQAAAPAATAPPAAKEPKAATAAAPVLKGVGAPQARLVFVSAGLELAEPSRVLLNRLVKAMGLSAKEVYLLGFEAGDAEAEELREALLERIATVSPEVVVTLGESAAAVIARKADAISAYRGRLVKFGKSMHLMVTLHPDELVADEGLKAGVWQDMRLVMTRLGK
jgi:uracil-DNA glycosylase